MNPLVDLANYGQSFWLDYIRRSFVEGGELKQMIEEDGLRGITSNPSIFEKAIEASTDYASELSSARCASAEDAKRIFETLAVHDIQAAADLLRPLYDRTEKADGFVSLEVSPSLAHDTEGTIREAGRLWRAVNRPNLMIKVPGTAEGLPAIETLLSEGINVNVTLLFSRHVYREAAEAYLSALETRAGRGQNLRAVASVASFFVSRIDTAVDALLEERLKSAPASEQARAKALVGKIAIANAKVAYRFFRETFAGPRWEALRSKGARPQRLLWASTSAKNPAYSDVLYIEELIGPDTVNTMPPATAAAFRDHGRPRNSLEEDVSGAERSLKELEGLGISLDNVTDHLVSQGVDLFASAFQSLLGAIQKTAAAPKPKDYALSFPPDLTEAAGREIGAWQAAGKIKRLWDGDATLWTGRDEGRWLGWLRITVDQLAHLDHLKTFASEVKTRGYRHAVVLGMGGSSLAPEVLAETMGPQDGFPELSILDSTDPAQIRSLESRVDLSRTLFIVSSKSGTTLEPNLFLDYFYEKVKSAVGKSKAGAQFVAVTDPGSALETIARRDGFSHLFHGIPSVGGRFSALSDFGMVPAAAMGVDVVRLLDRADEMVQACASCVPVADNPGLALGAVLGTLANQGRDKVTIIASPAISGFGAWLEQLLAESTGKGGKGLIPVDGEPLGEPEGYGVDRLFVYLRLGAEPDRGQDGHVKLLINAGQPVVRIDIGDRYDLGREFFRWEFATAVAGSIMRLNPFDQPDVEASKVATRKLTEQFEQKGAFPPARPFFEDQGIRLLADPENEKALKAGISGAPSLTAYLRAHLDRLRPGDYFALLAYVQRNRAVQQLLDMPRRAVRDSTRAATCLGFGPRFLHSTGQAYKGGPNTGVFLQITCDDPEDLPVPGRRYSFGTVKAAQALGDFAVLAERGRRALRVHLPSPLDSNLAALAEAIAEAVARQPA